MEGCFLIKAYRQNAEKHGHDTALSRAADLYQRTNTTVSDAEARDFVLRFIEPEAAPACTACG